MKQVIDKGESQKMLAEILERYGLVVTSVQETGESVRIKVSETDSESQTPKAIN